MKQHIQYEINTVACDISVAEVPSQPSNCPSTIEILGIQLQDVAINTDLGSRWVLGDQNVAFPRPQTAGLQDPQRSTGCSLDVEGPIDVLQEVPMQHAGDRLSGC